jgi:uncharacterized protein YqgV (UPF0045/DUF77 family)
MKISVDLSLYPLHDDYVPIIVDFIHRIAEHAGVEIALNAMRTQVYGEYDAVMAAITAEIRHSFETFGKAVIVAKIVGADARRL